LGCTAIDMLGPTPAGGVAIAERATQQPLLRARKQGRARGVGSGAIVTHRNVKRILLTMRALHPHRARRVKCVNDCCLLVADHPHFLIDAKRSVCRSSARHPARMADGDQRTASDEPLQRRAMSSEFNGLEGAI
jgi:hypothetical protein